MKKALKFVIYLAACIIVGVVLGYAVAYLEIDLIDINASDVLYAIVAFVLALLFSITIHELSHALYFKLCGIRIRAIVIFCICFENTINKWRVRFHPNNITTFGGIAIPNLPPIKDKNTFDKVRKVYYRALLFAPVVSGCLAVISIVSIAFVVATHSDLFFLKIFLIMLLFCNVAIFASSFIKTENIYGDFPAFHLYKNNDEIAVLQLCQYLFFNDTWEETVENSKWIITKTEETVESMDFSSLNTVEIQMLDWLIQMNLIDKATISENTTSKLIRLIDLGDAFLSLPVGESRDILFYHIIIFLFKNKAISIEYAEDKINALSPYLLSKHPSKEFYNHLSELILGKKDNSAWLLKNMNPNLTYSLFKIFPAVKYIEEKMINDLKK